MLLKASPGLRMSRNRLLLLLYMADRESLGEVGGPIVGGPLIATRSGPCHEAVRRALGRLRSRKHG